jgi:hypothetical protein
MESWLCLSYSSQTVCVHMYLCEFDETGMFMLWVLANNKSMHGVRYRRAPRDTSACTLTPQKCVLTSASFITLRCVCTSRYFFLPRPVQQHRLWSVVSQSLRPYHAQWVQCAIRGVTYQLNEDATQVSAYKRLICSMVASPSNFVLNMALTTTGASTARLWDALPTCSGTSRHFESAAARCTKPNAMLP